jgi:aspartate/methionine/tyrosine aminotransferase
MSAAKLAALRNERIAPFYVMELMKAASALAQDGRELIHLSVGEPDFTAPQAVQDAAIACITSGRTQYTDAPGLPELRERISAWYAERFSVDVPAERIFVTAGASAALLLACMIAVDAGDEVLMSDPCYPCNKHFVAAADGFAKLIACGSEQRFQLSAADIAKHWGERTRGVLLASPSNPTGTSIAPAELQKIIAEVKAREGFVIADEIYLGLSYEQGFGESALALSEDVISVNSFSKYFHMTGWRLGWLVVPPALVKTAEKLAQNLFICASAVAQHAALACFTPASLEIFESRRAEFNRRRQFIVPELNRLGLTVPVMPDGAFYAYADCSAHASSSWDFVFDLMRAKGVVLVPGRDFGTAEPERYIRLSYASSMEKLERAVELIAAHLKP